jgi:hypothetical protein
MQNIGWVSWPNTITPKEDEVVLVDGNVAFGQAHGFCILGLRHSLHLAKWQQGQWCTPDGTPNPAMTVTSWYRHGAKHPPIIHDQWYLCVQESGAHELLYFERFDQVERTESLHDDGRWIEFSGVDEILHKDPVTWYAIPYIEASLDQSWRNDDKLYDWTLLPNNAMPEENSSVLCRVLAPDADDYSELILTYKSGRWFRPSTLEEVEYPGTVVAFFRHHFHNLECRVRTVHPNTRYLIELHGQLHLAKHLSGVKWIVEDHPSLSEAGIYPANYMRLPTND